VPVWFGLVVWYPVCTKLLNTPSLSDGHYGTSLFWIPAVVLLRSGLLCPPPSGIFVCSSGSDRFFVPGLYEVIQYTLFLFFTLPVFVSSMLASSSKEIVKTSLTADVCRWDAVRAQNAHLFGVFLPGASHGDWLGLPSMTRTRA
jgi:hypothetical protein